MRLYSGIKQTLSRIWWGRLLAPISAYCCLAAVSSSFQWKGFAICLFIGIGLEMASILSGRKIDNMIITITLWIIGIATLYGVFEDLKKSVLISIGFLCFQAGVYFLPERIQGRIKMFSCSFKEVTKQVTEEIRKDNTNEGEDSTKQ